jgi:hypothetical protein
VLDLIRTGAVSIVVFARRAHRIPAGGSRVESAAESTQDLSWYRPAPRRWTGRHRVLPWELTHDRVRELIDDPSVTIPVGLDPMSIAAVRRIAKYLTER